MSVFLTIISWLLLGWLTSHLAQRRGRDPLIWFFIGMFLGLLGLVLLFILSPTVSKKPQVTKSYKMDEEKTIETYAETIKPKVDYSSFSMYYLNQNREQRGPISFALFKKEWSEGKIERSTYVWREGLEQWMQLESLPDLVDALNPKQ